MADLLPEYFQPCPHKIARNAGGDGEEVWEEFAGNRNRPFAAAANAQRVDE
jgi:hypothetical protein